MVDDIETIEGEFVKQYEQDIEDKDIMIKAQNKTILTLNKQIQDLQNEIVKLKKEKKKSDNSTQISLDSSMSNEELICIQQINEFKEISSERELTLEETKKFEIITKILNNIRNETKKDNKNIPTDDITSENLINLLEAVEE
jgi:hypothetical protein